MKFILIWGMASNMTEYLVMQMFVPVLKEKKDYEINQHDGLQPTPDVQQPPTVMKMFLRLNRDLF